ncbi:putative Lipoprotein [uncultured delta proteobacterium]|uniref:Putative Lipoprotein n=1 Tax=uncultured delta proteobacterium TaxID=34034 RepID=A0A212J1B2_9DELT|nr:putative Lipoprotein [uncultured delta proteobacterium]
MSKTRRLAARSLAWFVTSEECESLAVGGQAVMEGVMMRNDDTLSIAVRKPDGAIIARQRPWFTLLRFAFMRKAFVRGFPVLLETLVNGIKALNFSAEVAVEAEGEELKPWQLALTLAAAVGFAVLLFVVLPHLVTIVMNLLGFASGLKGLTFHLWDGFFKASIFVGYIVAISRLPDIRRVFEYHGAEHKVIWAYESREDEITVESAMRQSRLHPRCGTTFMLFVMAISIILHAVLVPLVLVFWKPGNAVLEHAGIVVFKLFLMIPISAIAYEAIRYAAKINSGFVAFVLRAPGMMLQRLTTREPDPSQLEVAMVALHEALGDESAVPIRVPAYSKMESV